MEYNLEFNIEQLIFEGFSSRERFRISNAIQQQLTRIFRENGIPTSLKNNGNINRLNLQNIDVPSGQKPETIGQQVAQNLYSALNSE